MRMSLPGEVAVDFIRYNIGEFNEFPYASNILVKFRYESYQIVLSVPVYSEPNHL